MFKQLFNSRLFSFLQFAGMALLITGCGYFSSFSEQEDLRFYPDRSDYSYWTVSDEYAPDSAYVSVIAPYKSRVSALMNDTIGFAINALTENKPESSLGNFAADAIRVEASNALRTKVDVALLNYGGLRVNIPRGPITVGNVYELMPFENKLVVVNMKGSELHKLLHEIVAVGGEPISGVRLRASEQRAEDVIVGYRPIQPDSVYTLATTDFLLRGGGNFPTLWKQNEVTYTDMTIRDALINYVSDRSEIESVVDGRYR